MGKVQPAAQMAVFKVTTIVQSENSLFIVFSHEGKGTSKRLCPTPWKNRFDRVDSFNSEMKGSKTSPSVSVAVGRLLDIGSK